MIRADITRSFRRATIAFGLFWFFRARSGAQSANTATLTTAFSFDGTNGARPTGLVLTNNTLYGATQFGGTISPIPNTNGYGTVFKMTNGTIAWSYLFAGSNGWTPNDGMILASDGYLYGTTVEGGTSTNKGLAAVFKISTNGVGLTPVPLDFTFAGYSTYGGLLQASNGLLYGGVNLPGGVFSVSTGGALNLTATFHGTNGQFPRGNLVQGPDGALYGTTQFGGTNYYNGLETGLGTVFKITPDGSLVSLFSFAGTNGFAPYSGLVFGTDGYLYGTTAYGGHEFQGNGTWPPYVEGTGTAFKISTNGVLIWSVSFSDLNYPAGTMPMAGVTLGRDGNLYGVTSKGLGNDGTAFELTTNGVLMTLYAFSGADGAYPESELILAPDGSFYGTTSSGGAYTNNYQNTGCGTIFRMVVSAPTTFIQTSASRSNFSMSWATVPGNTYQVQYRSNFNQADWQSFGSAFIATSNSSTMLDSMTNSQRFYRLITSP